MKKVFEKRIINNKSHPFVFGKCFFEQQDNQKEFLNEFLSTYKHLNLTLAHSPICPLKGLYENKTEEEIIKINDHFNELRSIKNKNISLASVGIVFDKFVSSFYNLKLFLSYSNLFTLL